MKTVIIIGLVLAVIIWLMAFFNVGVSKLGNEDRTFDSKVLLFASIIAAVIFVVILYREATLETIEMFDDNLMPYESGVWSIVGTALTFTCIGAMYFMAVHQVSLWIENHRETYYAGIISRVENRVRRECEIEFDKAYGDELARLRDIVDTYALDENAAPNRETYEMLRQLDEEAASKEDDSIIDFATAKEA